MEKKLQAVRGMNDILPEDAGKWFYVADTIRFLLEGYGYDFIQTPILEPTELFARGVGQTTDIVEKEMYSFVDSLNGESLTLRPEGTAACVRAVIEHHLARSGHAKLWYQGPMFRHERPQKGRYRQFHQVGAEAFGYEGPDVDAEQILMCQRLWEALGIEDSIWLEINSLGQADERARHRAALIDYFEKYQDSLDETAKGRLYTNPLRILDSKHEPTRAILHDAPLLQDFLGAESLRHFEHLQNILTNFGVGYTINPKLVRGLDYYNLTVYEFITDQLGAQGTVCGGGRYDTLVEQLGGKPIPACGFAMGIERLLSLIHFDDIDTKRHCDVYVAHSGEDALIGAFDAAELLRDHGLDVEMTAGVSSFKSQMKKADASGALFAVIIGEEEVKNNQVTIKALRQEIDQQTVLLDNLMKTIEEMMHTGEE